MKRHIKASHKKSTFSRAKLPFFCPERFLQDFDAFEGYRRLLGVNGPILAHFHPKFGSLFLGFHPSKNAFSVSGMENFAGVRSVTGIRQA